ncbi:MAG: hAT transposon family protein [Spiroplasma ixodetis]|nr:hAT transposon family protein [Spiroplasma ixodetis]
MSSIEGDPDEKPITKNTAKGLRNNMERLETAFMLVVWSTVLSRFNLTSKKIQSVSTSMSEIVDFYESLLQFVSDIRKNDFDLYESRARNISVTSHYEVDSRRRGRRTVQSDETNEGHIQFQGRDNFKVNTYNVILDRLIVELREKHLEYKSIFQKFSCLLQLDTLTEVELREKSKILQESFPNDLEPILFEDELHHFKIHCQQRGTDNYLPTEIMKYIRGNGLEKVFPNVDIAYRMLLCTAVTNCSAERSFSCLKRIKNYLRANLLQDRLNSLMVLAIESDLLLSIKFDDIIKSFAEKKARKKVFVS